MEIEKKLSVNIHNALNWLKNSGIQNNNLKNKKFYGSVNAWFDVDKNKYSFVYSEINGYFLTMMSYLYTKTNDPIFLKNGIKSADWLINNALQKNGGYKCLFLIDKSSKHAFKKNLIYAFDNGIIINGLVNLYKVTKKKKLLKAAENCANWIIKDCIKKDGGVRPVYEIDEKKFFESDKDWSTISGSYHSKIAMGLANLHSVTKKKVYLQKAIKIADYCLKFQNKKGRFISFPNKGGTNAHPHCYSAEGLWAIGVYLSKKKYIYSSQKALAWLLKNQNKNGFIPRLFIDNKPIFHERIDAIAQTLRLIYFCNNFNLNKIKKKERQINLLQKILLNNQLEKNKKKKIKGGFVWGKLSNGEKKIHPNSWVTFFAIQAIILKNEKNQKKLKDFDSFHLV